MMGGGLGWKVLCRGKDFITDNWRILKAVNTINI